MNLSRLRNSASCVLLFFLITVNVGGGHVAAPQLANGGPSSTRTEDEKRSYRAAMEQADQKITDEVKAHSELMKNLEYLTTEIGARLTGSPQMNRASEWTLQRFKDYGVDAHLENTQNAHGWTRAADTDEITTPVIHRVDIHGMG